VAVVGLSHDPLRPGRKVAKYLLDHGHEVIPVNPNHQQILGLKYFPDLRSIPGPVDIVDVFHTLGACAGFGR
jgi:predicted CoA-binding protein